MVRHRAIAIGHDVAIASQVVWRDLSPRLRDELGAHIRILLEYPLAGRIEPPRVRDRGCRHGAGRGSELGCCERSPRLLPHLEDRDGGWSETGRQLLRAWIRTPASANGMLATVTVRETSWPAPNVIDPDVTGLYPMRSVRTRYVPGGAPVRRNAPRSSVSARPMMTESLPTSETTTPGTGTFPESTTNPRSV